MKNVILVLFIFCCTSIFAQVQVSGTINDESNQAMPGVTVMLKGTTIGTTTDINGKYQISIPAENKEAVLVYSFIGYAATEKAITLSSGAIQTISFKMEKEDVGLNVVVVSASRRKEKLIDAPASVTVLTADKIITNTPLTVTDNLKKVPGVDIMQTGLYASNVVVRGFNNIFSGSLMTLVDNRIASVPSLKVNAFQLIPTAQGDISKMELVRGPGSALYGPNASDGVLYIETKSPLDMDKKISVGISHTFGISDQKYIYASRDSLAPPAQSPRTWVYTPELRIAAKPTDWFGIKVSGSYATGSDWKYYDPNEPKVGDLLWYGTAYNGSIFKNDSIIVDRNNDGTIRYDTVINGVKDTGYVKNAKFDRDFKVRKYNFDARLDFKISKTMTLILNGGLSNGTNIELTGLGAGQAKNWSYYYAQARFKWKNLFVQYYLNGSNSGQTYLIPQVSAGAQPPYKIQPLLDKSKLHVVQIQHSWKPINQLNLVYGADILMTRPQTDGTINGRFEKVDNINQYGGYLQADWDIIRQLKLVAAFRVDYHDKMKEVMFSPRAALVYKVNPSNTIRFTYNRAFSSPSTLNLYLDLSNGLIPNGINVRGFGNANGLDYRYGSDGNALMRSPYTNSWSAINDKSINVIAFDSMNRIIANGLASKTGTSAALVQTLLSGLFEGIAGPTGTITNVNHTAIDYLTKEEWTGGYSKVEKIKSTVNQTWELGYKGAIGKKAFITADVYYTRIKNFVSPLTLSTSSVVFNKTDFMNALGTSGDSSSLLWKNLQKPSTFAPTYDLLLTGLTDPVSGRPLLDGAYTGGTPNGTVYDDLMNLLTGASQAIPVGSVTPDDSLVGNDAILVYRNLGKVDLAGIDIGATYEIVDGLSISFAGSFVNKNRISLLGAANGFVGLNAPRFKTSLSIDHIIKKYGVGWGINWRWSDSYPANSAIYVGTVNAANLVDFKVSYQPVSQNKWIKGVLLSMNVNNILGYRFQSFPGTPQIGRFFMFKVAYTF
ncbi:MAG: TonB-dependent receptor [Bacteroidota bacterium]